MAQLGAGGGVSRDAISEGMLQKVKQALGMVRAEAQGNISQEHVKGQYAVEAADRTARAAEARAQANLEGRERLQDRRENSMFERLKATQAGQMARQDDAQQFQMQRPASRVGAFDAIGARRKALMTARDKNPQSLIPRLLGRPHEPSGALEAFERALAMAQEALRQNPEVGSADEAAAMFGATEMTPQELSQVNELLMLLRGR